MILPLVLKNDASSLRCLWKRSYSSVFAFPKKSKERVSICSTNPAFVPTNALLSPLDKCRSITQLKQIQAQLISTGLVSDWFASSRLIAFCAASEFGNLDYSCKILDHVQNPNAFSWNVTIRGHSESRSPEKSLLLYKRMLMRDGGSRPDNYTYPVLFKACARLVAKHMGHQILGHVLQLGFEFDIFVRNALTHMLVSCGELVAARHVFDGSSVKDVVSWNSLINGYVQSGRASEALQLYREMRQERIVPDEVTMIGVVSSCSQLEDISCGREFHHYIVENGLKVTTPLANALMDMYAKCGDLNAAQALFDKMSNKTIISWTTMAVGYARSGFLGAARMLFEEMPEKDVVPWNAMIGGYVQAKQSKEALALFQDMLARKVKPDEVTMVSCLSACSQLGTLDIGVWIHQFIEKQNLSLNVALGTALIDMYAKCGNITKAMHMFHNMPRKNSLTWTAIITGLAIHGNAHDAISHFEQMISYGLLPDEITYIGVLSACCHGGLVEEGRMYFAQMRSKFNLTPSVKHYSCMVDLLGRAGLLEEAEELIQSMPMKADAVVWGALFFACRTYRNVIMGEIAALKLLELDPHDSGIYVLLASMYKEAEMWEHARKVRRMMRDRGIDNTPGCSSIEVDGIVYEFVVRDKSHPHSERIYECLVHLAKQLELFGVPSGVPLLGSECGS